MAIKSYFFNALKNGNTYDRTYDAEDITKYLDKIVGTGVFPTPSTNLQVYAGNGMNIIIKAGAAWIDGHKVINTSDFIIPVPSADVTLNRIDSIVCRLNKTKRLIEFSLKTGTKATMPNAPAITRDENIYELQLATITVNKQINSISQSMIKDTRADSSVCGWVAGLIQQIDTTSLFEQWDTAYDETYKQKWQEFEDWFNRVKETLTTGANLQELRNKVTTETDWVTSIPIDISSYTPNFDPLAVYVNGIRLNSKEYINNGTIIRFKKPLDVIGTVVEIIVYKTVQNI